MINSFINYLPRSLQPDARSLLSPPVTRRRRSDKNEALAALKNGERPIPPVQYTPEVGGPAPELPEPMRAAVTFPYIILFLRHPGCPFATKTLLHLLPLAKSNPHIHFTLVTHAHEHETKAWVRALKLESKGAGEGRVLPELVDPEMAKDEYVKESGSERQGAKEGATEKDAEKQMVDAEEKDKVKATHVKSKTSEQTDQLRPRTTSRMSAEESVVSSDSFGEGMQNLTYTPDPQLILHDLFDVQPLPSLWCIARPSVLKEIYKLMRDDGITNGPTSGYRWLNSAGFAVSRESGSSTSSAQRTNSRCTNGGDGDSVGVAKDDDVEGVEEEGEGESGAGTVRWTHLSVDAGDWSRAEHALAALEKETGHQKKEQEEDQRRKVGGA